MNSNTYFQAFLNAKPIAVGYVESTTSHTVIHTKLTPFQKSIIQEANRLLHQDKSIGTVTIDGEPYSVERITYLKYIELTSCTTSTKTN